MEKLVTAVGAMSGTSLDGVDVAEITTDGQKIAAFGASAYHPYSAADHDILSSVLGKWPAAQGLEAARGLIHQRHLEAYQMLDAADLYGFHGQTLAHDPGGRGTHQLGDGAGFGAKAWQARCLGFSKQGCGAGGQGAPLAPFFHFACAQWAGLDAPVAFLNLGGVGNLTWLDPRCAAPEEKAALLAFDTGPANAPLNDLMRHRLGQPVDQEGRLAATGQVDPKLLSRWKMHPYFSQNVPKSLDRNAFSAELADLAEMSLPDALATAVGFAAFGVAEAVTRCPIAPAALYLCGGGRHNLALCDAVRAQVACPVQRVEAIGLNGDMLGAQAFAYLAVRVLRGLPFLLNDNRGVSTYLGGASLIPFLTRKFKNISCRL